MSDQQTSEAPDVHPGLRLFLRRRRMVRIVVAGSLLLTILSVAYANWRRPTIDDCSYYNHHPFEVTEVLAGDLLRIKTDAGEEIVQLLAVAAPRGDEHWADNSKTYTTNRLTGKTVALLLDPPQTRDADGHLLAYVYPLDADNINIDITKDGMAYADRRTTALFTPQLELSETEARRKSRGLWKNLQEDAMPAWRRDWLAQRRTAAK